MGTFNVCATPAKMGLKQTASHVNSTLSRLELHDNLAIPHLTSAGRTIGKDETAAAQHTQ